MKSPHYDLKVSFIKNPLSPSSKDPELLKQLTITTYGPLEIEMAKFTKTFLHEKRPMVQLIIKGFQKLFLDLVKNHEVFMKIDILQYQKIVYSNYYVVERVQVLDNHVESMNVINDITTIKVNFILQSVFQNNLQNSRALSTIQPDKDKSTFYSSTGIYFEELPRIFKEYYGDSIKFINSCDHNEYISTRFSSINIPASNNDLQNLDFLLKNYPFSTAPILYGFDEVFNIQLEQNGGLSKLIFLDLLHPEMWYTVNQEVVNFLTDRQTLIHNRIQLESKIINSYLDGNFIKKWLLSDVVYRNPDTGTVKKFDARLKEYKGSIRVNINPDGLPELIQNIAVNPNINVVESILSEIDFQRKLDNLKNLYSLNYQVKQLSISSSPIEIFELGKKLPKNIEPSDNVIIAADILFTPYSKKGSSIIINSPTIKVDQENNNFNCSGVIEYICVS